MSKPYERDQHYLQFVGKMNEIITENISSEDKQTRQYMNSIISYEEKFKTILLSSVEGEAVYLEFMKFILDDEDGGKGNMLSARVYFRERQNTFSNELYPAFHKNDATELYKFDINYRFCVWSLERYKGPHRKKLLNIVQKIIPLRHVICENNLPLAISRAKIFSGSGARKVSNAWMDTIQMAAEGLMVAIDKFVPAEGKVKTNREFNGVAIGKMGLEMQDGHSQTLVKLPPKEKRILYRARKAQQKCAGATSKEVAEYVKESFKDVKEEDIQRIEAAANGVASIDHKPDGQYSIGDRYVDSTMGLEEKVENKELSDKILTVMRGLSIVEKKIVLMKFGDMYGVGNE